jgi:hypothetical protein
MVHSKKENLIYKGVLKMIFTVEENHQQECIEIFLDKEGLELMVKKLNFLLKNEGHIHFMTPSWAGNELTEVKQGTNTELINHLRVVLKPSND